MFKVKKTEHINKTFRMSVDLIERLEKLAQSKGVSLNNLVAQCCEYALEHSEENESSQAKNKN